MKQVMKLFEIREKRRQRVWFIQRCIYLSFIDERNAEIEIRERCRCKGFD